MQCSTPQCSPTRAPAARTARRRPWATWWTASRWCTGHPQTPPSTRATRTTLPNITVIIFNAHLYMWVWKSICFLLFTLRIGYSNRFYPHSGQWIIFISPLWSDKVPRWVSTRNVSNSENIRFFLTTLICRKMKLLLWYGILSRDH